MTAYQNDFFGGVHRADPWKEIVIKKLRFHCPVPPFSKTECHKAILAEILSQMPQMSKAIRGIIQTSDFDMGLKLIEAVIRHEDAPAPDTIPRATREAQKYLAERGELDLDQWNKTGNNVARLEQMLVEIETDQSNIDSSLEARFHIMLMERFKGRVNWLRPGHVKNFTVDFLSTKGAVAIEIDGWEYHNDKIAFTKDRRKSRIVQRAGYTHLQYSGSELSVKNGIHRALDEIDDIIKWRLKYTP